MPQEFQQHWLSAYLDNELSNDERALVERRLEEDAEARQLLDDLRRVRGLVATLPGWQGSTSPLDISRLAVDSDDDDDYENEIDEPIDSSRNNAPLRVNSSRNKSGGSSFAQWRTALALAAGLLLMLLCVPLFWQGYDPLALQTNSPVGGGMEGLDGMGGGMGGSMGGGMGGGGEVPAAESVGATAEPTSAASMNAPPTDPIVRSLAPSDPARMPPAAEADTVGSAPGIMDTAKIAVPPPPSASPAARNSNVGASRSADKASSPPGSGANVELDRGTAMAKQMPAFPLAPAPASADPVPPAAPVAPAAPIDQPAEKLETSLANSFRCARSDAWSEAEVDQALPQLRTLVDSSLVMANNAKPESMRRVAEPENAQAKSDTNPQPQVAQAQVAQAQVAQEVDKPGVTGQRAIIENELLITDVPKQADTNALFSQIQSAQPLTEIRIAQTVRATGAFEAANTAENLSRTAQRAQSRGNNDAAKAEALGAAEAKNKLNEKNAGLSQDRIVLFVTENEAKKILTNILGHPDGNYWRVVPTEPNAQANNDGQKKVIVILNHPR